MSLPSPTGISPTYDLLGQFSDEDDDVSDTPARDQPLMSRPDNEEHHSIWRKINEMHDDLLAKEAKEKANSNKRLGAVRERSNIPSDGWGSRTSVQGVANKTNAFFDQTPTLMKALDLVGQAHPFAGITILAFKAVYELELKRRENDKKILAVYGEMRDMMAALTQLRNIKGEDEVGPDGISIKARLEHLVEQTAEEIKTCANTCDAYLKKKLIVKILTGGRWDEALSKFAGLFYRRRTEFEFALSIHMGLGIDKANATLNMLKTMTTQVQDRMDDMLLYFKVIIAPEHKELAARIADKGGVQAVLNSERFLRELINFPLGAAGEARGDRGRGRWEVPTGLDELREEIREDIEAAVARNTDTFLRKFDMQQRQIVWELSRVVHREGDRVIGAVTAGPHDRIVDPDLHAIWKEMGWRGSTKARHFVLALRDYFRERMEEKKRNGHYEMSRIQEHDEWTLEWINVTRLQPIVEAFDDDASNFITISEVNDLTVARPKDWSLLHWLAYWAVGWQIAATAYRDKINHIFAKMFSLKPYIHPAVRSSVDAYLHHVWTGISELTSSVEPFHPTEALREKFQTYIDDEEDRLREGLEAVRYDIDAIDTLVLITGPGRIEKFVFPLLYLLLKKDYEVMRLARENIINKDELWDAADTIGWILQSVDFRYRDLQDIFKQQKLDPRHQLKGFACGLFEHWRNSSGLWSRSSDFQDHIYDEEKEAQGIEPGDILNYPLDNDDLFDPSGYDTPRFSPSEVDAISKWPLRAILGPWCGFMSQGDVYPCQPMMSVHFHAIDDFRFQATSSTPNGTSYVVTGEYGSDATSRIYYTFTIKYTARFQPLYFRGYIHDGNTLTGAWSTSFDIFAEPGSNSSTLCTQSVLVLDAPANRFIFKRNLQPETLCCRPDPVAFQLNRPRALWMYALAAVRRDVGMRNCTWSYFKKRRDNRKRYIELLLRLNYADLDDEESMELARIRQTLTAADARLYETLYDYELRTTPVHLDVACDHCESTIIGSRIICLDCESNKPLNLCDDPRCRDSEVHADKRPDLPAPHLPEHTVFKVRTMVHLREFGKMDQAARTALKKARTTFSDVADLWDDERSVDKTPDLRRRSRAARIVQAALSCVVCKQQVCKPCWYCVMCHDDVFICLDCDAKGPLTVGSHDKLHALVLCQDEVHYGPLSIEQRLELFEQRFTSMENGFDAMETRFGVLEDNFGTLEGRIGMMDDKLTRIEKILDLMWTKSKKIASSRRSQSVNVPSSPWGAPLPQPPGHPRPLPVIPRWEPVDLP